MGLARSVLGWDKQVSSKAMLDKVRITNPLSEHLTTSVGKSTAQGFPEAVKPFARVLPKKPFLLRDRTTEVSALVLSVEAAEPPSVGERLTCKIKVRPSSEAW